MNSFQKIFFFQKHEIFLFRVFLVIWLVIPIGGVAFSLNEDTGDLLGEFNDLLLSSKPVLNELSVQVGNYKEWFKNYQTKLLLANGGEVDEPLNQELDKVWKEIERLEQITKGTWIDTLLNELNSYDTTQLPPNEINDWIRSHRKYVVQTRVDVSRLGKSIEEVKQDYPINETLLYAEESNTTDVSPETAAAAEQVASTSTKTFEASELEQIHNPTQAKEYEVLETSLLYLLGGLEIWGQWLDPANEIGLLPEAEGRFMLSNTPILQAGSTSISGGIGVVGFAEPIMISHDGVPQGFTEEVSEPLPIGFDDSIEDVFQKVSYHDRLFYQYGVQVDGRTIQIYRKPIGSDFTLSFALERMGAPPDMVDLWIEEYAEIAHLPQTIQLAWLISGNPLAQDYKLHTENLLKTFDLSSLFIVNNQNGEFALPQAPSAQWVNEDPFWAEVQNQPILKNFTDLLSGASEEVQRSFIVSLFFLESSLPVVQSASRSRSNLEKNVRVRSKPFFWPDQSVPNTSSGATALEEVPARLVDLEQGHLVTEAFEQKTNLIHYWVPGQGSKIILGQKGICLTPIKRICLTLLWLLRQCHSSSQKAHKFVIQTIHQ